MQFTLTSFYLASALFAGLTFQTVNALPTSLVTTPAQLTKWISTTNANLTFTGNPINTTKPLSKRQAQNVQVVYCDTKIGDSCGGNCVVYNGPNTCLDAPSTNCLMATADVGFCDRGGCGGSCNQFSSCGSTLNNGFCSTPGTASILVPFLP
ncbi:hypothetical protein BDN72DRAFT_881575 [Pluteus cervinus]|uniref:Uncharacterized protein n=1 Tax=Pluteus cervinus TaxID=181527 RepID=A0ACD3AFC4_9AGAR|nr:hypothetical protein BDN72DRAFT_881575 [Pluteus cervinus]